MKLKNIKKDLINSSGSNKKMFSFAKQKQIKMAKSEEKKRVKTFERTIEKELFDAWSMLRRTEDAQELIEITGKSYPIIYRALNFGHVKEDSVCDDISKFYALKSEKQKQQAKEILKNLV